MTFDISAKIESRALFNKGGAQPHSTHSLPRRLSRRLSRRPHAQFMASLSLSNPLAEKSPTNVDQDSCLGLGLGLEEPIRGSPATRQNEQPSVVDPNAHPPLKLKLSPWPRQRHGQPDHRSGPSALVRGLAAIKHFFFGEDKTLHEGYIPNYRSASSVPPNPL